MKLKRILIFAGCTLLLAGCGRDADEARDMRNDAAAETEAAETAQTAADNENTATDNETEAVNEAIEEETEEEAVPFDPTKIVSEFSIEYKKAVEEMRGSGTTPDKRRVLRPEGGAFTESDYAVFDVDCDGTDELVLRYLDGGKDSFCAIYEYDVASTGFRCEFIEVMSLKPVFYDNATIKATWEEDTGLNKEIPSFNIYTYDEAEDVYAYRGYVESWDLAAASDDTEGNAFPVKYDLDENGIVYSIQYDRDYEYSFIYDDSDYLSLSKNVYDAKPLRPTWFSL